MERRGDQQDVTDANPADPLSTRHRPEEYDELQRGEEQPVTVEHLEHRPAPEAGGQETAVPDPGERPGAVRLSEG
jgi:hypothetical protein